MSWLALSCATTHAPAGPPASSAPTGPVPVVVRPPAAQAPPIALAPAPTLAGETEAEAQLRARLSEFYASLGSAVRRRRAYLQLFAPALRRFIGLQNVTRERALATADAYFADKRDIRYALRGAPKIMLQGDVAHVAARASGYFETPVPARWAELVPELAEQTIVTSLDLGIELELRADGAVTSYSEHDASPHRRMRVAVKTRGYELPFLDGCWEAPSNELASVELPVGTVLEVTGESLPVLGCGPATTVVHLRLRGLTLWVLLASYELVPNPAGGSSMGGTTFLEWAD